MSGPAATAMAAGRRHEAVGRGRSAAVEVGGDQGDDAGMISAAPMPSSSDHPIIRRRRFCEMAVRNEPQP
jgi:hypothetical protein